MLTLRGKFPLLETQRRFEPMTLHHAGQQAQNTTNRAILPALRVICKDVLVQIGGKAHGTDRKALILMR